MIYTLNSKPKLLNIEGEILQNHNTIKSNIVIPWDCDFVEYYVSSFNTVANMLIVTWEDYITFKDVDNGAEIVTHLDDQYKLKIEDLATYFGSNSPQEINFDLINDTRTLRIRCAKHLQIIDATYRTKLLLGLYNVKFDRNHPIEFTNIDGEYRYRCPDMPIVNFNNKLYLTSLQGRAIHTSLNQDDYTPSIIASIDEPIIMGKPLIVNFDLTNKPIKTKINVDALKHLELQVVDFMFQPVIITSPVFVTLKIKPCKKPTSKFISY